MGVMKIPYITVTVDEPGPHARAMLEERRRLCPTCHGPGLVRPRHGRGVLEDCPTCDGGRIKDFSQPSPRPTVARVLEIVRTVIRARRQACYGELRIGDDQLEELARAIVTNIAAEIATGDL